MGRMSELSGEISGLATPSSPSARTAANRPAMPVGPDYQITLNLYQLAGLRVLIQKEISAVERHHRVIGGDHHEYLEQLKGVEKSLTAAKGGA